MAEARMIYTTWPDPKAAAEAAQTIVLERLAACANIIPGALSLYWWNGEVQASTEVVVMFKTTRDRALPLRDRIKVLHPYSEPAVMALEIDEARCSSTYLDWIKKEARPL